jgi:hypothetical protein
MNNITVQEILESPFKYENMLVHATYRTNWRNYGNRMGQDKAYFTGRISFISTSIIQIENATGGINVPHGYFISIVQATLPIDYSKIAYENFELKNKISRLKELLEGK